MPTDEEYRRVAVRALELATYERLIDSGIRQLYDMTIAMCLGLNTKLQSEPEPLLDVPESPSDQWTVRFRGRPLVEFKVTQGPIVALELVIATCTATLLNGERTTRACYLIKFGNDGGWRRRTEKIPAGADVIGESLPHQEENLASPLETEIDGAWILGLIDEALGRNLEVYRRPSPARSGAHDQLAPGD